MAIELEWMSDPACVWSWGSEPKLRKLLWELGDEIRLRCLMGGLARSYGPEYRDSEGRVGSGPDCFADLISHWLDAGAASGMPVDPRLWTEGPLEATYPACMAVKAAAEQGRGAAAAYLRRLREGICVERRKLDHTEALVGQAAAAGLDVERFRVDLGSNAIVEAFAADFERAREVPESAREQGLTRTTEGRERLSFPSAAFVAADGTRHWVFGWQSYERYREAAVAAGAKPRGLAPPTILGAIERFGRCATRELEVLCELPAPVARAELWGLARDWRLRPVPALTGTLWELA